eukprot:scaffold58395_cov50-Cyclotella_meneghiniana.AAC.1
MSHYGYNKSAPLPQQLDCPNVSLWLKIHTIPLKIVSAWISAPLPQQLDCPNVSLWLKIDTIIHSRLCVLGSVHPYHSSLTAPMSHYGAPLPQQLDCPNVSLW